MTDEEKIKEIRKTSRGKKKPLREILVEIFDEEDVDKLIEIVKGLRGRGLKKIMIIKEEKSKEDSNN